jgi:hypothetical protein
VPEERALAAGVYYETSPGHARNTVGSVTYSARAACFEEHVHHLVVFADLHPMRSAILQK